MPLTEKGKKTNDALSYGRRIHGPALTAIIEGLPANLPLSREALNHELFRRQQGYGAAAE